ncbi:MAG TPA: hypothetical protein VK138_02665 [Acidiferrobacterales bacterium]|nr:hypothetical protein [Acidiferrobacterales bacterium]
MGTATTLSLINFTPAEDNAGATYGQDMIGMLNLAQVKAGELIQNLQAIVMRLPVGDPNIATIDTLIANLS